MRIGLAGTQSVGKTTLLNALRSERIFKDYSICDETTRQVKAMGFNINEQGNDNTQYIIMLKHLENAFMYTDMLTDRTALDCIVYSDYLKDQGNLSLSMFKHLEQMFLKIWPMYDKVFFIYPEFNLVEDGVRSADEAFRSSIHKKFLQIIDRYELDMNSVTGSVVQRVQQVIAAVTVKGTH